MAEWQSRAKWTSEPPPQRSGTPPHSNPPPPTLHPPPSPSPTYLHSARTSAPLQPPGGTKPTGVRGTLCGWTKCCKMTWTIMTMNFMSRSHGAGDAWLGWLVQLNCYRYGKRLLSQMLLSIPPLAQRRRVRWNGILTHTGRIVRLK